MAIFNYAAREMTAKIVYYGPGLSGKTSSIQYIHQKISPKSKGKLVSLATETDRTLFFDFFPVEFGQIGGFKVKFNFYTVPGQVFYNTTRKLVLKGADAVVFVADSQSGMMEQNLESLENLRMNLKAHNIDWETVPFVLQYNKRDIPGALPLEEMRRRLNPGRVPEFETSATTGMGIMEAMKTVCRMVLEHIQQKTRRGAGRTDAEAVPGVRKATEAFAAAGGIQGGLRAATPPQAPSAAARPAEGAPSAAAPAGAKKPGIAEAATLLHLPGSGEVSLTLCVPVRFQVPAGADGVNLHVQLRVQDRAAGPVSLGKISTRTAEEAVEEQAPERQPPEQEPKKGFFSRLFRG